MAGVATRIQALGHAPPDLTELKRAVLACRRCELWRGTTQGIVGEGPRHASLMLVGEQPGNQEDIAGRPFAGPAGQVLDRALASAGIARSEVYITNAVKHFKHEPRGKRRLHKTPNAGEVAACRWWLDSERALVRPKVIVAMGATAALGVLGRAIPIMRSRGQPIAAAEGAQVVVTIHPSYLLRIRSEADKAAAYAFFTADLGLARTLVEGQRDSELPTGKSQ